MSLFQHIGFSTNIFDNPANIAQLVEYLSEHFPAIEIEFEKDLRLLIDSDEQQWRQQRDRLNAVREATGVHYSTHAPYIGIDTDISNGDEVTRLSAVDYLGKYIARAAEIGARFITIHPGYVELDQQGLSYFEFGQLAKSLDALSAVAARHHVDILLENTGPDREKYIVLLDEQHDQLCRHSNVFLTLDLVHFHAFYHHLSSADYLEKLKNILPDIRNAHFNDVVDGKHIHIPLGSGNFDFHQVLQFMHAQGYQGNFIIEESGGGYAPEDFVTAGREYIDRLKTNAPCPH
ncbi:sugar phosphate isomerase/epimerase family protein [Pseudomonas chlororaphis]|jgi:sugar phosphate isomerase/epimerase|uniref:sugar phosphate isomerase/epimerase family protein n=1 Tax=Pseudomonas chlororaphis TaxID=587753 RepID=UPI0015DF9024|nr:sugar phosphate isomerase/epimerase family protein [Pseudomonas chlororaphis]QLL12573.1 sugar phosphate isomerase/epimerase [Pseudomonas chlororaphis subsp. aurantiaca]